MASYIYNVFYMGEPYTIPEDSPELVFASTRKYEAQKFLEQKLTEGISIAVFEVIRCRDGIKDTMTCIDVYEFMKIDVGEVL